MPVKINVKQRSLSVSRPNAKGLTLLELVVITALIGIISTVAMATYQHHIDESRTRIAIKQIRTMELAIDGFAASNYGNFPANLSDVGLQNIEDPWGNDYQYLNIAQARSQNATRKDRNLVPINSDYDLYSRGPDERSVGPLTAEHSRDDIVRANNGAFVGIAEDY